MSKYRKISVETIEAFKWTGGIDQEEDPEWFRKLLESGEAKILRTGDEGKLHPEVSVELHIGEEYTSSWNVAKPGMYIAIEDGELCLYYGNDFNKYYERILTHD